MSGTIARCDAKCSAECRNPKCVVDLIDYAIAHRTATKKTLHLNGFHSSYNCEGSHCIRLLDNEALRAVFKHEKKLGFRLWFKRTICIRGVQWYGLCRLNCLKTRIDRVAEKFGLDPFGVYIWFKQEESRDKIHAYIQAR